MEIYSLRKIVHDKLRDTSDIKNRKIAAYIKSHDMTHTENQNGIFVNISLCPEEHIRAIYHIINLNDVIDTCHMDRYIDSGISQLDDDLLRGPAKSLSDLPSSLPSSYPSSSESTAEDSDDKCNLDYKTTEIEALILQYSCQ